ncbi:type IV toxin-antitoxin system AbiEi family antitoxin domain-containing protein [Sphingomonas sanguinis]|uniref:Transcriptional regulator n=1 Tax=Sphingomonas sanguinis TaxID=33051 RepID=A0A147IYI4_9SPHN|nr:type IV toxin-antitoxin system AbiEi family antitoxin domain-containing protein [Sphingomonas sanguinis]KTW00853.1 transcriptional regulator [Sphingomonas sanguinis]
MAAISATSQRARAVACLRTGDIVRLRDLLAQGISAETMARLVRDGLAVRPARGVYQAADAPLDARHMLAEAAALAPKAVICLASALQFYELTLQRPSSVWMAIDRTGWKPKTDYPPMRFVRFSEPLLNEGVERHRIEGVQVAVFDPAKSVVDCFRYRNKVGLDLALEGLREGFQRRRFTVDQLSRYATHARVWTIMRPYVEATIADGA